MHMVSDCQLRQSLQNLKEIFLKMEFEVNLKEDKITETFKKMEKKYLKKT